MGWVSLPSDVRVDELSHYGAKGQKWGRRRWQNPDGSYTQAGRIHYGIGLFKKKPKMSKDAKLRAKERVRAKNEAARQEAYEAEARRAMAETEAERAKTALREAKKQNSLAYKLGSKAASAASDKMSERKAEKESRKPLSKNAERYIDAIQSGNKRKIKKYAAKLNNDEYRKAIDRINMKYEMDRLATDNKIAKGKQTVERLRNTANVLSSGVDIWNAGAGIVSAFSGVNVPKVNTKYEDPIDKIKKQLEYQTKQEALDTAKSGADKARYVAKQEKVKADTALKEYYEKYPEEKEKSKVSDTVKEESTKKGLFGKKDKTESSISSEPKWQTEWRDKSEKDVAKRSAEKTYSYEPDRRITTNVTANDAVKALNALTGGGYTGRAKTRSSYEFKVDDLQTPINTIKVDKKSKNLVESMIVDSNKFYNLNDYKNKVDNPDHYSEDTLLNNVLKVKGSKDFDVSKLPKEQQQMFFAMLNGLK